MTWRAPPIERTRISPPQRQQAYLRKNVSFICYNQYASASQVVTAAADGAKVENGFTMRNQSPAIVFDQERASSYDSRRAKSALLFDALHLLIRLVLSDIPADARVLCVGVGTGSELIDLANACPEWRFTAVEPAKPMLDICRRRAEESGISSRCVYHEGYLASLPASDPFDAATCLLVSHSFIHKEERCAFFREIALRLRPGGYLVSSDLASDMSTAAYRSLLEVWIRMMQYSGIPVEEIERFCAAYGREAAVLPPHEVASIIAASGFDAPVLFSQTLLIHAWYAQRTSDVAHNLS